MARTYRKFDTFPEVEQKIRRAIKTGMTDDVLLTISYVSGFELFGSYETWAQGWKIVGKGTGDVEIQASREHLDDAVALWIQRYEKAMQDTPNAN